MNGQSAKAQSSRGVARPRSDICIVLKATWRKTSSPGVLLKLHTNSIETPYPGVFRVARPESDIGIVLRRTCDHERRTAEVEIVQVQSNPSCTYSTEAALLKSTQERTNIFFLKAHKCASSTIQNILLRFGLERDLTFVLPATNNYIGNPDIFSAVMINENYSTLNGKYNIFAHHSRYDSEGVHSVMYNDAVYVTILRHPADLYESLFAYYKLQKVFNVSFEDLLKSPVNVKKINKRYFKRIGFNQMSFDLGFKEEDFNSTNKIIKYINKLDAEFDLVMISEWMEASLVLLADVMNWPLENVMSLRLNSRTPDSIYTMSNTEKQRVIELNSVDYMLYTHFLNKFRKRITDYGEQRMKTDIEKLMHLNFKLQFRCVQSLNKNGFGQTQAYKLRDESDRLCFFAARGELEFTEQLRRIQRQKVKVIKKLELLLNNEEDM